MKKLEKILLLAFVIFLFIFGFFFGQMKVGQELSDLKKAYKLDSLAFTKTIDKYGNKIAEQDALIVSQSAAIEAGILEAHILKARNIKAVQSLTRANEKISNLERIIAGWVVSTDTVFIYEDIGECLPVPKHFEFSDDWLSLRGVVTMQGVIYNPGGISILNKPTFTIAYQNKYKYSFFNYFSKPTLTVFYENKNPYAQTQAMSNVIIREKQKWYQSGWLKFGAGVITGFVVNRYLLTPNTATKQQDYTVYQPRTPDNWIFHRQP